MAKELDKAKLFARDKVRIPSEKLKKQAISSALGLSDLRQSMMEFSVAIKLHPFAKECHNINLKADEVKYRESIKPPIERF